MSYRIIMLSRKYELLKDIYSMIYFYKVLKYVKLNIFFRNIKCYGSIKENKNWEIFRIIFIYERVGGVMIWDSNM